MEGLKKFAACVLFVAIAVYFHLHPSRSDMTTEERRSDDLKREREKAEKQHARDVQAQKREAERRAAYEKARWDALDRYQLEHPPPLSWPDRTDLKEFEFYLLALSIHASFCADGHRDDPECKSDGARGRVLALRGLWPEANGIEVSDSGDHPRGCSAPDPRLSPSIIKRLEEWMPGTAANRYLQEWHAHGSCTGLSGETYFSGALNTAESFAAVAEPQLQRDARHVVDARDFRTSIERANSSYTGAFTLHCRKIGGIEAARGRPTLMEIRVCVDDDGAYKQPATLIHCDGVNRHDEGCGSSFWIPGRDP
jgi:ribonuclease I